jgi:hypothetical protein
LAAFELPRTCFSARALQDRAGLPLAGFPSLIDVNKRRTPEEIFKITKMGFGRMPAFDRLADPQREAILAYVLGTPAIGGIRPDEAESPADKNLKTHAISKGGQGRVRGLDAILVRNRFGEALVSTI